MKRPAVWFRSKVGRDVWNTTLSTPEITKNLKEEDGKHLRGVIWLPRRVIYINCWQPYKDIVSTVLHEAMHLSMHYASLKNEEAILTTEIEEIVIEHLEPSLAEFLISAPMILPPLPKMVEKEIRAWEEGKRS